MIRLRQHIGLANYLQIMRGLNVSLSKAFKQSRNLGDLTAAWVKHLHAEVVARDISTKVKFATGDTASLLAPAALIAKVLVGAGIETEGRAFRVLLLGDDAIARMDRAMWAQYAGNFLGDDTTVKIYQCKDELPTSPLFSVGEALGLQISEVVPHASIEAGEHEEFDLAIWIHPASEVKDHDDSSLASALALHGRGVPVFACVFNELDWHVQNYMLSNEGMQLSLLSDALERGAATINNFGISSQDVGIDGGWGAILCRLEPSNTVLPKQDVDAVYAAVAMLRIEGASNGSWIFGRRINGVAFNKIIPTGLLGSMAVDDKTGYILTENNKPRIINVIGHLWTDQLARMPKSTFELLAWASRIKLAYLNKLPKEEGKRKEAIAILTQAHQDGVIDAAIGLARGYEATGSKEGLALARELYKQVGADHPMSAYAVGHALAEQGQMAKASEFLEISSAFGYPPATTDFGIVQCQLGNVGKGMAAIKKAAALGDSKASFIMAEQMIEEGHYMESFAPLRAAWSIGHAQALETALWLAKNLMDKNMGKRVQLKQELRDIESFQKKRGRLENEVKAANA